MCTICVYINIYICIEGPLTYFPGTNIQLGQVLNNPNPGGHMGSTLASQNPQLGAALATHMQASQPPGVPNAGPVPNTVTSMGVGVGLQGHGPQQSSGMLPGSFPNVVSGQRMPMVNQGGMKNVNMKPQGPQQIQNQRMVMQQGMNPQGMNPQQLMNQQQSNMLPPNKPGTPLSQMQPMQIENQLMMQRDSGTPGSYGPQNPQQMPRQGTPTQFLNHGPNQVPSHVGMVPSPVHQMPNTLTSSQMAPSPGGYLPSHSPQIVPSPASLPSLSAQPQGRPPGMVGAPSPGSALNTPMSMGNIQSPVNRSQDDQAYLEKVKQLSKYIEPLRRMIARIDKDEGDKKRELSKMKNLLDILSNPNKRLHMDTLLKCEQVLEKLELKSDPNAITSGGVQPHALQSKEYNICQPLYEAVIAHINLPTFYHTLQRTFGPSVNVLHGEPTRYSPPSKRKKIEDDELDIPDVLQGEIARLDRRFKVNINPIQQTGSKTVHLICQLDDKNLPCVPPIMLTVPENYPQQSPQCETDLEEYVSTQFLQMIHKNLITRISKMAEQYSITTLLDTWEMSVRQACAPVSSAMTTVF